MAGGAVAEACRQLSGSVAADRCGIVTGLRTMSSWRTARRAARKRLARFDRRHGAIWYHRPQDLPADVDQVGSKSRGLQDPSRHRHILLCLPRRRRAVDTDTGEVELVDYLIVEDGGELINPMVVDGQMWAGRRRVSAPRSTRRCLRRDGQPLAATLRRLPFTGRDRSARRSSSNTWSFPRPISRFGQKASARVARSARRRRSPTRSTMRWRRSVSR